jgi:hypothetical protein
MGANQSSQNITTTVLNNIMLSIMTKNSTSAYAAVDQTNDLTIAGNTDKVTVNGITQVNSSKINVASLISSVQNNTLQADLIANLTNKIAQEMPVLAIGDNTNQAIKTSVSNTINSNITVENFQKIAVLVKSSNTIKIIANAGVDVSQVVQKNESTAIMSLVDKISSEIVANIKTATTSSTDATQKSAGLLPDLGSFGLIFIIIIIVVIGGGLYYFTSTGLKVGEILAKPQVIALIAAILAFFAYESISSGTTKK